MKMNRNRYFIFLAAAVFFSVGVLAAGQILVMPWENSDGSDLEKPSLVVKKKKRLLKLFDGQQLVTSYRIALGSVPVGDKIREGDGRTPEGDFFIFTKNPESRYFLSLGISYPNTAAARRGLENGLITPAEHDRIVAATEKKEMPPQKTNLGGEIYIHGMGNLTDWTEGCIALTNREMKELYDRIPVGTPVRIEP